MVIKDNIKEMVDEEMQKLIGVNEIDLYRITKGIPNVGLKLMVFYYYEVMLWIKQIIEINDGEVTPENKIEIIQEIIKSMDKYFDEKG